jgi:copper resistance protein B
MNASIRRENTMQQFSALALGLALSGAATAWAQPAVDEHAGHHGAPSAAPVASPAMPMSGMNHGNMATGAMPDGGDGMAGMDHGDMKMHDASDSTAAPAMPMSGMNHEAMKSGAKPDADGSMKKTTTPAASDMSGMDHGDMNMQGGTAPADARDPNAYSDGFTLDTGKYALPGPERLRLADEHSVGTVLFDRLERAYGRDGDATSYDAEAWFGRTYNRLVLKAEGEYVGGRLEDARTEVLWGHAIASYWDTQLGVRFDSGEGPNRTWAAFGVQGLAPYWFELDLTGYVGEEGRTALRLSAEYELLLTQRVVLQPRLEANLYGKSDEARGIGSGLSDAVAGLRLRYELNRQFAPYIGVEWASKFGQTADLANAEGKPRSETLWVAGLRFWF